MNKQTRTDEYLQGYNQGQVDKEKEILDEIERLEKSYIIDKKGMLIVELKQWIKKSRSKNG